MPEQVCGLCVSAKNEWECVRRANAADQCQVCRRPYWEWPRPRKIQPVILTGTTGTGSPGSLLPPVAGRTIVVAVVDSRDARLGYPSSVLGCPAGELRTNSSGTSLLSW